MDSPENLMVIDTLMVLDGPADWDRFLDALQRGLLDKYPPFRQRVIGPRWKVGAPRWRDDSAFDIERQLVRATLPDGEDETLQRYVEGFLSAPLPTDRPLWQTHLIDGYRHGSVVYSRIHHCIADGIALSEVVMGLTSEASDGDLVADSRTPARPPLEDDGVSLSSVLARVVTAPFAAARTVPELFSLHAARSAVRAATEALGQVEAIGRVADKLILSSPPEGPLTGRPGIAKRAVWADPFALDDVKRLGRKTGTTVNDVLMAVMAGALGTYVAERGGKRRTLPTMVPVNVRPPNAVLPPDLGNDFALVVAKYPAGHESLLERIAQMHLEMEGIKHSVEVPLVFSTIWAIGQTTKDLERTLVDFFSSKAIGVTTNVPGPREARYLAGTRIRSMLAWVPTAGDQTLGASIFTYDGDVFVGFKADARCVPEPEELVRAFNDEVKEMIRLADAV